MFRVEKVHIHTQTYTYSLYICRNCVLENNNSLFILLNACRCKKKTNSCSLHLNIYELGKFPAHVSKAGRKFNIIGV